jgi:hypothetical protein
MSGGRPLATKSVEIREAVLGLDELHEVMTVRQDFYALEVAGVVMEETILWDVPLMVSRGTSSVTFLHAAGKAARAAWEQNEVETFVFALYDHDAAGLRISRQVEFGLREHAGPDVPIHFKLLAVRPEQIVDWNLPTRPAKRSDPEAKKFHGPAVELDAIPPNRLRQLVSGAIESLVDDEVWHQERIVEESERRLLLRLAEENFAR